MHLYFTKCCVSFVPADSVILIFRQALLSASFILQCPKENSQDFKISQYQTTATQNLHQTTHSLSLTHTHTHSLFLSHTHTHIHTHTLSLSHTHTHTHTHTIYSTQTCRENSCQIRQCLLCTVHWQSQLATGQKYPCPERKGNCLLLIVLNHFT